MINDIKISENFRLYEFECNDGNHEVKLDPKLLELLQEFRTKKGKPIYINSAYRTPEHNKAVGGATDSAHLRGEAADITVRGMTSLQIAHLAEAIGFTGIGVYDNFCHVDVREKLKNTVGRSYDYWDYRTKK